MSSQNIGLIFTITIVGIFLLLSYFVSSYFYIISIPALLFLVYAILEIIFPSFIKSLFKIKIKKVLNPNGENIIFHDKKSDGIRLRFYKEDDILNGEFTTYYMGGTECIKANFVDGKIDGECWEFSISGGIKRIIEVYDMGSLISKKVYFTSSNRGQIANESSFKKSENARGVLIDDIENKLKEFVFNV